MADIAAFFAEPRHSIGTFLATALPRIAARVHRLRDRAELADARFDLDARRRADTGISAPRGLDRVTFLMRGGLR